MSKHIRTIKVGPYNVTQSEEDGKKQVFVRMIGYWASATAVEHGCPLIDNKDREHSIAERHLPGVFKAIDELEAEQ